MLDKRIEPRLLCADLVDVEWKDQDGCIQRDVANLEDISLLGACLQVERPVAVGTECRIAYPSGTLMGKIAYCVFREIGYFLGIEFASGYCWPRRQFRPQHLLDPGPLVDRTIEKATSAEPAAN